MRERTNEQLAGRRFNHRDGFAGQSDFGNTAVGKVHAADAEQTALPLANDFVARDRRLGGLLQRRLQAHDRNTQVGFHRCRIGTR